MVQEFDLCLRPLNVTCEKSTIEIAMESFSVLFLVCYSGSAVLLWKYVSEITLSQKTEAVKLYIVTLQKLTIARCIIARNSLG